ncbi:MAG: STAS-like domain-containing protein [Verrucomicrobiaceae bacterium]|nr:STAS-like domain-containing protein [Verrucomicrobiaceae bacterium]
MTIQVADIVDELCITYEDGEALLARLRPALVNSDPVTVDFEGTRLHMSPFFNASIAALLKDYSREDLREKLHIRNLPGQAVQTLIRCLDVGEKYFHNPAYQQALDNAVEQVEAEA